MADKSIQFLLLIDALKNTNKQHPKTSKELMQNIESAWQKLFPQEESAHLSVSTIGRHIKAMNQSGLYNIVTCKNSKDGYFWDRFPFEAAEFSLIAQALYRSTALSTEETKDTLEKFFNHTDDLGEGYMDITLNQIKSTAPQRKPSRATLPIIRNLLKAIWKQQQVRFNYYRSNDRDIGNMKKRRDENTGKEKLYQVSPYFLVWNADDLYLIAHYDGHDEKKRKRLSHFKVSLISDKVQVLSTVPAISIAEMTEYPHYHLKQKRPSADNNRQQNIANEDKKTSQDSSEALKMFSLDKYMRENLFMFHNFSPPVDITLYFREDSVSSVMSQFNLDKRTLKLYPTGRTFPDGEKVFSAKITAQENEGLYLWLMQQGGKITVAEPASIRNELKRRHAQALKDLELCEQGKQH